ncbi:hypothetical protein [Dawidia soli]|uniref:Uncharacterized protein n=1 Tax=Dawidia soli TaxID=2782352 RepID=A0AAP2DE15_9BACT|nr:hypothetical protein [Dawidia soli]MBT1690344.1 hypothetical protein [Dawidia soli]
MILPQETTMHTVADSILPALSGSIVVFLAIIILTGDHWKQIRITIKIRRQKKTRKEISSKP